MAKSTDSDEETYELTREQVELLVTDIGPERRDQGAFALVMTAAGLGLMVDASEVTMAVVGTLLFSFGLYCAIQFDKYEADLDDLAFAQSFDEWAESGGRDD
ncbi:hypothetical protein [Halopiger djelfimassiliensis]|uniref:hypothetical protein n=1 Tax=Halopiger djelfimassiliensis TaxID=1293047 RepID=UPI000677FF70|nr:hypothetical protein [Halopiger djelfimassiliensis]